MGEEDIWRSALAMHPTMTQTRIDDFIATPTNMGPRTDYLRLLQVLNMRAARASADARRPNDSPPLSNAKWRTMQREEEWVRRATQAGRGS